MFGTKYQFGGPFLADYDMITHAMVNGTWKVVEPAPNTLSGGNGTWSAQWTP